MPSFSIGQPRHHSLGGSIGLGLATGITHGLQSLAADRLASIRAQNQQRELAQTLGALNLSPTEQSDILHLLPPEQRLPALQALATLGQQQPQQSQQQPQAAVPEAVVQEPTQYAAAQKQRFEELNPEMQQPSPQQLVNDANALQAGLPTQIKPADVINQIKQLGLPQPNQQQMKRLQEEVNNYNTNPAVREQLAQDYANAVKNNESIEFRKPGYNGPAVPFDQIAGQITPAQPSRFAKPLTPMEKIAQEKLEISRRKEMRDTLQEDAKESKEFADSTRSSFKAAKESDKRIGRMEQLIEKGKLGSPLRNAFVNLFKEGFVGPHGPKIDITALQTADAQEFNKLAAEFSKGAKEYFPGRVTDTDIRLYMQTIPSLTQSKAGMQRLLNSMKSANKAAELRYQAMREAIKANGGRRPADLEDQVEDLIGGQLDQLSQQFIKGPLLQEPYRGSAFYER